MMRPSHRKKLVNALKELEGGGAKDLRVVLVVGGGGVKKNSGDKGKRSKATGTEKNEERGESEGGDGRGGVGARFA